VNVKFINFKFTVLGDVRTPGTYNLPVQRTNLLDALGAAGDLPTSAQRYDILLYRDYSNRRTITKIDLRNKQILYDTTSFILRHNDVLYVKTRRARSFQEEFRVYGSVVSIALGVTLLIVNIIK
jgi:polysaccharide export outer membrane protein